MISEGNHGTFLKKPRHFPHQSAVVSFDYHLRKQPTVTSYIIIKFFKNYFHSSIFAPNFLCLQALRGGGRNEKGGSYPPPHIATYRDKVELYFHLSNYFHHPVTHCFKGTSMQRWKNGRKLQKNNKNDSRHSDTQ